MHIFKECNICNPKRREASRRARLKKQRALEEAEEEDEGVNFHEDLNVKNESDEAEQEGEIEERIGKDTTSQGVGKESEMEEMSETGDEEGSPSDLERDESKAEDDAYLRDMDIDLSLDEEITNITGLANEGAQDQRARSFQEPRRMNALSTPIERTYDAQMSPLENIMDDLANTAEPILATKCGIVLEHLRLSLVSRRPQNQSLTAQDAAWIMNHLAKSKLQIDAYHTLSGEACKVPDPRIYPFLRDLARIYRQKLRQLEADTMGLDMTKKHRNEILEEFKSILTELNSLATVVHMPYGNKPHRPLWSGLGRYI